MNDDQSGDMLTPEAVLRNLPILALPRQVRCYARLNSTMDEARALVDQLPAEALPLLVLAEEQTAGRGRLGRPWSAPPGSALLFSLALRPHWLRPEHATSLVWAIGVGVCEGIAAATPLQPRLKWPNDVLLPAVVPPPGRNDPPTSTGPLAKIAGLLLEMGSMPGYVDWAILGCGLNVNAAPTAGSRLRYPASSLAAALGRPVLRLPVLRALLLRLDHWYGVLQRGNRDQLFAAWRGLLVTLGQQVTVETASGSLTGLAEDVDPTGALHIRDATGKLHTITTGDVGV